MIHLWRQKRSAAWLCSYNDLILVSQWVQVPQAGHNDLLGQRLVRDC